MKLNSLNKNANSNLKENVNFFFNSDPIQSAPKPQPSSTNHRSRRQIKKTKEDSFTSDINDDDDSFTNINHYPPQTDCAQSEDVIMEGNFLYRYALDQIELDGTWSISSTYTKEKFSYLFMKKTIPIQIPISKNEIDFTNPSSEYGTYLSLDKDKFILNLCTGNIFEVLLIPNQLLFNSILSFLSGEYHGFFVYYGKTIEDKFNLSFFFEDNQVRVTGDGTNNLGDFNVIGYVNFYTIKDQLVGENSVDSTVIKFGSARLTRIYHAFNESEQMRVMKSYQHSRKKYSEETSYI